MAKEKARPTRKSLLLRMDAAVYNRIRAGAYEGDVAMNDFVLFAVADELGLTHEPRSSGRSAARLREDTADDTAALLLRMEPPVYEKIRSAAYRKRTNMSDFVLSIVAAKLGIEHETRKGGRGGVRSTPAGSAR